MKVGNLVVFWASRWRRTKAHVEDRGMNRGCANCQAACSQAVCGGRSRNVGEECAQGEHQAETGVFKVLAGDQGRTR